MEKKETPFFARFLEDQDFPQVKTDIKGGPWPPFGGGDVTLKWPSDGDDDGPLI